MILERRPLRKTKREKERERMKGSICVGDFGRDPEFNNNTQKMMMEGFRPGGDSGGVSVVNAEFKRLNLESFGNRDFGRDPEFSKKQRMMVEGFRGDDVFGRNSKFNLGIQQDDPSVIRVGWRVLIIDDPNPNSGLFKFSDVHHLFIDFGCIVHAITEPGRILSTLKQEKDKVDFVICNIHMKGLDEATLFELVGLKDVFVIMMSSYMDTRLVTEGMNHGASSFVLKPQTFDDIENISSLLLEKKKYPSWFPLNLSRKFDQVVHQLGGLDEAVPEKIQELMNAVNIIPVPVIDKHLKIRRELARLIALRRSEKDVPLPDCLLRGSYRRPVGDSGVSGVNAEFKRLNLESFGNGEFGRDPEFSKKQRMLVEGFRGDDVFGRNSKFNLGIQQGCEPYNNPSVIRVGWRVLIIDDPNPNSGLFKFSDVHHLFIDFGCIVHAITEPSRILSTLKQTKDMVDFVICNIHMKGLDEATLFDLVGLKDVLVIMMSSYRDTRLVIEGMNHGASLFVLKPQTFDDIQNISSFLLERKKYPSKFPLNLNRKFDQAVVQLGGLDEAVPEKIQELMNAENIIPVPVIAAHLKIRREIARLMALRRSEKDVPLPDCLLRASYRSATSV